MSTNDTDIVKLNLNDTFYDWYLRTNQVIDYVNPINVYDVFAGAGLQESRTGTPGTIELTVGTQPSLYGITTLTNTSGLSEVALDYSQLSVGTVSNTSIFSFQSAGDQIYKVEASDILPPDINGDHAFGGTITVADLIVDDGTITLNNTGSSRDNCGLVIESISDTNSQNVSFTYDTLTDAWYSSEYLGVKSGKGFVTDSSPKAVFPFIATQTQGQVDLRLQTSIGSIPEYFSIQGRFDSPNSILFSHYYNNALVSDILELTSSSTNGSSVIVKDTITITDILNSTPFSQTPAVTSVPITDSTDGYLSQFVNRIKLAAGAVAVGDVVRMGASTLEKANPSSISNAQVLGIVESISSGVATVITSGPFKNITGLTSLTVGSVYYLDPNSAGDVTASNPDNTNGVLDKPVFIATSTTGGVLIPDFASTGSTSIITGGGGGSVNNAFSTLVATSAGTITSSGETTLTITGGTNIGLTVGGSTLTINSDIPESSTANQLLRRNNANAYEWFSPLDYSVISKTLTGEISSVQLTPGSLLGRRDDTDDSNNAVQALTRSEVLNLLGFTSNSFIRNIRFEDAAGATVNDFDPATNMTDETVSIRAGANITFSWDGNDLYINSTGDTNVGPGGGTIMVAKEGSTSYTTDNLIFETDYNGGTVGGAAVNNMIEFAVRQPTSGAALISARPTTNYLPLGADAGSGSHPNTGVRLNILGDTDGSITTTYTNARNEFRISLASTINVNKIVGAGSGTEKEGLILSAGDQLGRNTLLLRDSPRTVAGTNADDSTITIDAFTELPSLPDTSRVSTTTLAGVSTKCVSIYSDANAVNGSGDTYTYPFRFHKIIVDQLVCDDLQANEALKSVERLRELVGIYSNDIWLADDCSIYLRTNQSSLTGGSSTGTDGVSLIFNDEDNPNPAYLHYPSVSRSSGFTANMPASTLMIADNLMFGLSSNSARYSATISRGGNNYSLQITGWGSATSELSIAGDTVTYAYGKGSFGTVSSGTATNTYTYLNHLSNTNNYYLRLKADTEIKADTLTITDGTNGFKFDTIAPTTGHVLYVDSTSGSIGTVKSTFIIKPFVGSDPATDPINTLYYSY